MRRAAHIVALHGALWSSDRWYRWSWYVGPAAMALLVVGWICIGKPTGATASAAAWGRPVSRQPTIRNLKVTPTQQPNWADLELVSCFANRPLASETACTRLIDERQVVGQRLAAVYTERGYLRREKDPARALIDYDSALRVQPGFVDALAGRAWINMTRGDYDAALPDLNKALDLSPTAGTARY